MSAYPSRHGAAAVARLRTRAAAAAAADLDRTGGCSARSAQLPSGPPGAEGTIAYSGYPAHRKGMQLHGVEDRLVGAFGGKVAIVRDFSMCDATCNVQNMQHATCSMQRAERATCRTCNMQHATCHVDKRPDGMRTYSVAPTASAFPEGREG